MADETNLTVEERRLKLDEEIERQRLELDKERHRQESSLLRAHLGVLITAIISLATIVLSLVQFFVANLRAEQEAEARHRQDAATLRAQHDEWRLNVLKFLSEHRADIYSPDPKVREQIRTMLEATLPHEVLVDVLSELAEEAKASGTGATWEFNITYSWVEIGTGDCEGSDIPPPTLAPAPVPQRCDESFAGFTAICRDGTGCTYKNVKPEHCTGGDEPGKLYACVPEVVRKK